jgi:hypothetical protein
VPSPWRTLARVAVAEAKSLHSARALLAKHTAVVVRGALASADCARWASGVLGSKDEWTEDFDGDQACLGRAFYTHLETDRTALYFADAAASDARVERHAPGLQVRMRGLIEEAVGGRVVARSGWCGAGVHVFPSGATVASQGGVRHFDTEGLAEEHVTRRAPAVSLVAMLVPAARGGGLRIWPVLYAGRDCVDDSDLPGDGALIAYGAGDVVLFDSYSLHRIERFDGDGPRVSATLHGAEVDAGLWETWF